RRSDRATVRTELLHGIEAPNVIDLVEQDESQDLSNTGNRSQQIIRNAVVDARLLRHLPLQALYDAIVVTDELEIGHDGALNERVVEEGRDGLVGFPAG